MLKFTYKLIRVVAVLAISAPAIYTASPSGAAIADEKRTIIAFARETQPTINRPTLDSIKLAAKQQNISLAEALDEYVAKIVASDPSVTARARSEETDDTVEPEIKIDDLWLSELTDLKLVAKTKNITFEEAIESVGWQPRINQLGAEIAKTYPDEISGLAILNKGYGARIGFKGEVPERAVALAKTLPVAVELVGNKGFSEAELKQTLNAAHDAISQRADLKAIHGSYDIETGVVSFEASPRIVPKDDTRRKQLLSQLQPAQPTNRKIKIVLTVGEDTKPVAQDNYMRGGGHFSGCTTGFNVTNGTSYRTTTAKHCGTSGSRTYSNHSVQGGSTTSDFYTTNSNYDIAAWTRGTMTLTRTFYYDWHSPRYAYDVGSSPVIGQTICHFGVTSGAACSEIESTNVTLTNGGVTSRGIIVMESDVSDGGDSGGPWYYGNRAWGIHGGVCSGGVCGGDASSFFSPAYLIPSVMGSSWYVWTAPPGT
ncbi:S1 family peptidase [Streptosporangium sp. NPDC000095]|uniref:S1 family peptidase n=1 Tax=Streptosporangium sp. NPDC000095 TaxID=3366184 RepID=UPI00368A7BD0